MDITVGKDIKIIEKEDVYSPDDDTYLLIDMLEIEEDQEILEMGVGTGIISLFCAAKGAKVTAVDIDKKAVELTKENSRINDIPLQDSIRSDLFSKVEGCWEMIIFNPPYLPSDKDLGFDRKWDGGERGDETLLRFLNRAIDYIDLGGRIYFIFSDMSPLERINEVIEERYEIIECRKKDYRFETIYGFALSALDRG